MHVTNMSPIASLSGRLSSTALTPESMDGFDKCPGAPCAGRSGTKSIGSAQAKELQPSILLASSTSPPGIHAFTHHQSALAGHYSPFMDGTIFIVMSTGSLPVVLCCYREKRQGVDVGGKQVVVGGNTGRTVMERPPQVTVKTFLNVGREDGGVHSVIVKLWKVLRHMYLKRIFAPAQRIVTTKPRGAV